MDNLRKSFLVKGNSIVGAVGDKNFSTAPIGVIQAFSGTTIPNGYLVADGTSYKVADYPDLYAVIGNTYGGDTENFNVPNLVDKFIQGSTTSGTEKEAGLPNITGGWMPSVPVNYQNYVSEAVTAETKSSGLVSSSGTQPAPGVGFKIDASKSSAVYGKSTTVQPPALTMVYIIKAFHTNEGVDSGVSDDVIEYVNNSLVDKADKSYVDDNFATMDKIAHDVDTSYMSNGVLNISSIRQSLGIGCYEIMGQGISGHGSIRLNIWQVESGSIAFSCCITDFNGVRSICSNEDNSPTVDVGNSYFNATNKIIKVF